MAINLDTAMANNLGARKPRSVITMAEECYYSRKWLRETSEFRSYPSRHAKWSLSGGGRVFSVIALISAGEPVAAAASAPG